MTGQFRKITAMLICMLTVIGMCACGTVTVNVNTKNKADAAKTEDTAKAEDTSKTEEAPAAEDTSKSDDTDVVEQFPQLVEEDYDLSRYDDNKQIYFESHGNAWTADEATAQKYPELAKALNDINEAEKKDFTSTMDEYDADARQFAKESGGEGGYSDYSNTGLCCVDFKVASLLSVEFSFLGGAHPDTTYKVYNIDVSTGKLIPLSDVIKDQKGLNKILEEKLTSQYPDNQFFDIIGTLDAYDMSATASDDDKTAYSYTFSPNGLTFHFDPIELAPYVDGEEQIDLTYDDLESVLNEGYPYGDGK